MPRRKTKKVILLRNNKDLLLADLEALSNKPKDTAKLDEIVAGLREAFDAPDAVWEVLRRNQYEKRFPVINRIIAESFDFALAQEFFGQFKD